jgi:predicted DNA-binding transcriptional regulator AlpA
MSRDRAVAAIAHHLAEALLVALEVSHVARSAAHEVATRPEAAQRAPGALLDVVDLSERIGVSVKTIYSWRSRRVPYGPPAIKVGKYLRWKQEVVSEWIATQQEE